jgi:peptide/nickel transport system permease protein
MCFFIIFLSPGDVARSVLYSQMGMVSDSAIESFRQMEHLDDPIVVQYLNWGRHVLGGDLGNSLRSRSPVADRLASSIGATLRLAIPAMIICVLISVPLGILCACFKHRLLDRLLSLLQIAGLSIPEFWLAFMLIIVFALELRLFPVAGYAGTGNVQSIALPVIALSFFSSCMLSRIMRACMIDALGEQYVLGARAKGAGEARVIFLHALKNALLPYVTMLGIVFGWLLSGSVVIEIVFNWPGIGWLLYDAIRAKDYPVIQGCVLFILGSYLFISLLVDISYQFLNPRIRYAQK